MHSKKLWCKTAVVLYLYFNAVQYPPAESEYIHSRTLGASTKVNLLVLHVSFFLRDLEQQTIEEDRSRSSSILEKSGNIFMICYERIPEFP